jgi:putative flavoprotein involved in K+ transport
VTLLGRLQGVENGRISLAPDLRENLARIDQFEVNLCQMIDQYIQREGLQAPEETLESLQDGYQAPELLSLDLKQAGITTIVWAMGFRFDFSLVKLPVFDQAGFPVTDGGVSRTPGLYFAGLPWLPGQNTGILLGVGENAERVTEHLCARDKD